MSGITVQLRTCGVQSVTFDGWRLTSKGEYTHSSGVSVKRRDPRRWEVIGGARDGTMWQSMNVAMHNAEQTKPFGD